LKHSAIEKHGLAVYTQNVTRPRDLAGCSVELDFQGLCLGYCAALKQNRQPLVILRHQRRFPATPAPLIKEVSQSILILAGVLSELHYYSLIFLHAVDK